MKFTDLPATILNFRIKPIYPQSPPLVEQPVWSIVPSRQSPGEFDLGLVKDLVSVKPVVLADTNRLNIELSSGRAILAQLANPAVDGSIELQIAFFTGDCLDMGVVEIGVDEYVQRLYPKISSSKISGDKIYEELINKSTYTQAGRTFFFLLAGHSIRETLDSTQEYYKQDDEEDSTDVNKEDADPNILEKNQKDIIDSKYIHDLEPTIKNSFCIVGERVRFIATQTQRPDGKPIYIVTRLTKTKGEPDRALRLVQGELKFVDWTQAGQIQTLTKAQISTLTEDTGSYLNRWKDFVNVEGELLLKQARAIGVLKYSEMKIGREDTVIVHIDSEATPGLSLLGGKSADTIELVDEIPEYLKNQLFTFEQFNKSIEKTDFYKKTNQDKNESGNRFNIIEYAPETRLLTLKVEGTALPPSGQFILSLAGQIAQIKRRRFARDAILAGRSANAQLGILLEEKGEITQTRLPSKIKALTAFVTNKVFRNPPTEKQIDAIDVALNTPDIALIQGPPGTGKTTVIAAIIERLNEIADKRGAQIKGAVLLTGFQHDAVENMIDRLSLNGLPVPKFGKRSGQDDFTRFEHNLNDWCNARIEALRKKNPQIREIEQELEIKNLYAQYLRSPSRALALSLAQHISKLGVRVLDADCAREAARIVKKLSLEGQLGEDSKDFLTTVRRLRHRPESFADDGPERAMDTLDDLKDDLNHLEVHERDCLEKASNWRTEDGTPPFLAEIESLKKKLLNRFTAPAVFRVEKFNDDVIILTEKAIEKIKKSGLSSNDAKSNALVEFLAELESNPYGVMDAVSDYAYAFAATCQQSVNKKMQHQKGIKNQLNSLAEFQKLEYEYVIVDEAARVSPPDLLVAMAQGKRIILVGDHRQLPHIVDDQVLTAISDDDAEKLLTDEINIDRDEKEWSKISLFEHMFVNRLPELEKKDGIPRRVTLDRQYRMHPLLGEFVSRNFYERFDKIGSQSEAFGSGRPEEDFIHSLADTDGKPAIWLNVPSNKGKHERSGTSWIRQVEATAIANQLQIWMNSPEGNSLSFGVISFYKAQADLIKKRLNKIEDDGKKLRIGTVDSFQGMEFDVVFLSMVKSQAYKYSPDDNEERAARSIFGHLCLYNRLNVAMSRQKKVLVVVGDSALLDTQLAQTHVPGLVDYLKLCRTKGRVLTCR